MLEDPTAPAIYRVSGMQPYPTPTDPQIPPSIQPRQVTLRDRITIASLLPFSHASQVPPALLTYLCNQFNLEIEKGDTYPMISALSLEAFGKYWFQNFGAIMLLGQINDIEDTVHMENSGVRWEEICLGSFYIKPNYPGRSSHICNGGFLVTEAARNRGVGRLMGEGYLEWAPKLGYSYSVFNLVYETNVASCRIWDALGFKRIGRIKACGNLRSHPGELVDAIMYGRDLGPDGEDFVSEERFDKIRYYLKHGTYPSGADRAEKSRLRSAATHYKLIPDENGQGDILMLKDKEVVSDPQRQYEIARKVHAEGHGGINKTTATIAEKHHWVRIKETVSLVIKNCPECKELAIKAPVVRPMGNDYSGGLGGQSRKAGAGIFAQGNLDPNSMIERLVNYEPNHSFRQNFSNSKSPEAGHNGVPLANMRALQEYNDIPLDPQIMRQVDNHQYSDGYSELMRSAKGYVATEMASPLAAHENGCEEDAGMATEQHTRQGDDPAAYQDPAGLVHSNERMQDGDNGHENPGDMDLEELLRRS